MKKTLGEVASEVAQRATLDDDVVEYRRKMEGKVVELLHQTADEASKNILYAGKDFYVVGLPNMERAIANVPRWRFWARRSCPTPVYKQAVWKYHCKPNTLEFLWALPSESLYYHLMRNFATIPKDQHTLANFCFANESGHLLKWVIKENGEKQDAVIKINTELKGVQ